MTSRLALPAALLCASFASTVLPSAASADGFRGERHGLWTELEVEGAPGAQLSPRSSLAGHLAARLRVGGTWRTDSETSMAIGDAFAAELSVHAWFNARPASHNGDVPDLAIGLVPRLVNELRDARLRVPSLMSLGIPEVGVYVPWDGSDPVGYAGYSHAVGARLSGDDDEVLVSAELRLSFYFLFQSHRELTALASLGLGITVS